MEGLEDEADRLVAEHGELAVVEPAMSSPPIRSRRSVGRSRQPSRCINVDLPEPDGPRIAAYSPGRTGTVTPRSASTVTPSSR